MEKRVIFSQRVIAAPLAVVCSGNVTLVAKCS